MNETERELRELAALRSEDEPIVTLYLDTRWADEQQRERVRLFVEHRVQWAREQGLGEGLDRSLDRIHAYVEGLCRQAYDVDVQGVAIFACEALGLWKVLRFGRPFRNQFSLGDCAHLLQLARMLESFQPVVIAVVDARGARVYETAVGSLLGEARIAHRPPRRHSMGGWSQLHFQRHVDRQIERNHREAAAHVVFLLDQEPRNRLVLVGPDRMTAAFEKILPPRALERLQARLPHPKVRSYREGEIRATILDEVIERLLEEEQELQERNVHRVVGEALAGGLAVLGPQDVALAANEERIHQLLLEEGLETPGWRCQQCEALGAGGTLACDYCGGTVTTVELGAELARKVIEAGGEVQVLGPQPLMEHYDGVAAVLRHRGTQAPPQLGAQAPEPIF